MIPNEIKKMDKKPSISRRKVNQSSQFDSEITINFDQFFRFFNYYYPGKNKQDIINKCMTGNTYWITTDALYYPESIDLEAQKIEIFRKKTILKNGSFPPTKDSLQEEKFILFVRKIVSRGLNTLNLQVIKETPIDQIVEYLEISLVNHEISITNQLQSLKDSLVINNQQGNRKLLQLDIPYVRSSKLFAYEHLQKEVIDNSIKKAVLKQNQPRCDFCFLRQKDVIKCANCDLYTHSTCFARAPKDPKTLDFLCDMCKFEIPLNAKCELCPIQNGHFLQLSGETQIYNYKMAKGQSNLKFKIIREKHQKSRHFIHVSCYVLRPQCMYNLAKNKVQGLHLIDRTKKNPTICAFCGNMIGITVGCNNQSCRRSYHPQCAKRNGLSINVIRANNKALLQIYCQRHKKPQCFEYLRDSVINRIKQLRKFYENLDYEMKKYGINHGPSKVKKPNKIEQLNKQDKCLVCQQQNDYLNRITNCRKCYGWFHETCCNFCPYCDV